MSRDNNKSECFTAKTHVPDILENWMRRVKMVITWEFSPGMQAIFSIHVMDCSVQQCP